MNATVIETRGLTKRYGPTVAVEGLDLEIRKGEVFGLLGPNGSGKTTTILMLIGLTEPTSGELSVLGLDPRLTPLMVKRQVGYLPDAVGFYDELTAWENLRYITKLNGLPAAEADRRIGAALERMGLARVANQRVATFSRGMRQRLGLAELLCKTPQVVILDEPTLGLDPEAARDFLALIRQLKEDGITVLLSSHLLHQVQEVCDRVGLFSRGRMLLTGSVEALARQVLGSAWRVHLEAQPAPSDPEGALLRAALEQVPGVRLVQAESTGHWRVDAQQDVRSELAQAALGAGARLIGLTQARPGLDEVYARYFQEAADEA
ncbi:MAG: ABC transporter ATP-binding protein [Azospira oryzae]|uniref:ABC transporter ATP-binding protein n=1 Tax=Pelomicrobium methylotrophicum TaxID=2602750 RepID=A0A5C7ET37_9PROT|nr:ABC transporter ATP-binding protein [Pelomicrobium methylotrophicum]PZP56961.1 MAG: ABC transporter ATP-binding protein [Azospira oryzae]PZP78780.1 MAG: ABC transporter ATP-binding protein [Azospira oryzae]TXF10316.1 ABC transporter ATP-binding protein [Pelomicrobium methylotrophicum]